MVDVKSAIARLGIGSIPARTHAESQIEYLAWFRFPVTWGYLGAHTPGSESEVARRPQPAPLSLTLAPILPVPIFRSPVALDFVGTGDGMRPTGSATRWEMMVPKMDRPPARPSANFTAAPAPALAAPAPKAASLPAPVFTKASTASVPSQFAPSFLLHSDEDQFLAHYWPHIIFAAIAIAAIGCLIWGLSGPSTGAGSAPSSPFNPWSYPAVSSSGRSLTVYEPSRHESDYRMEFSWVPDAAGIGWVFRARDRNNFYAARLSLQQRGANGVLMGEHFSVLAGAESAHSRKMIPLANATGLVRVKMDAIGPAFKLFVENRPVDGWNDARLGTGALGFYNDGDHLPKVLALSFTLIDKAGSRTALVSLP